MSNGEPRFRVSPDGWKLIGSGSLIAAAICLAGLAAVLALTDSDALATIALVLAITAFIVQIIVTVIQNAASREAEAASRELNSETNQVLQEIKATSAANQKILAEQFNSLLEALISGHAPGGNASDKARRDARPKADEAPPEQSDSMAQLRLPASSWLRNASPTPSDEDSRILDRIRSWPDEEEGLALADTLRSLSPQASASLQRLIDDEISSRQLGGWVGLGKGGPALSASGDRELADKGLAEEDVHGSTPILRLTEEGREVGRLLSARGSPPPRLANVLGITTEDEQVPTKSGAEMHTNGGAETEPG